MSEVRRGERLRRQLRLVEALLLGETLTRRRAAQILGVEVAAAARHLRVLRDLPGVRRGERGDLSFDRSTLVQQTSFPAAIAACLSHSIATLFRGTQYEAGMREALTYVISHTPRRSLFQDLRRKFVFVAKGGDASLPESAPLLDELLEGVLHSRRVRISYARFSGKEEEIVIEPLSIAVYEHQLYVLGRTQAQGVHPYRFSRVSAAEILPQRFKYPEKAEYDPEQMFANSMGVYVGDEPIEEIVILLKPRWRQYATTHRWHPTQRVQVTPNGVAISLHARVTPETEAWVLSFGADAVVLRPAKLRASVAKHARTLARAYIRG